MKLAGSNSNSASIFLCKISQTGISPASIRPFLILKFNLLPSTLAGKQNYSDFLEYFVIPVVLVGFPWTS